MGAFYIPDGPFTSGKQNLAFAFLTCKGAVMYSSFCVCAALHKVGLDTFCPMKAKKKGSQSHSLSLSPSYTSASGWEVVAVPSLLGGFEPSTILISTRQCYIWGIVGN